MYKSEEFRVYPYIYYKSYELHYLLFLFLFLLVMDSCQPCLTVMVSFYSFSYKYKSHP